MKKNVIALVLFLSLTQSLIGFEGLYVGASTGPGVTFGKQEGNFNIVSAVAGAEISAFPTERGARFFHGKWEADIFAGYGWKWCRFYGGLESFYRYSRSHFSIKRRDEPTILASFTAINTVKSEVTIGSWHYGLDGRFGFFLNPLTLLYGRIGVEGVGRFQFNERSSFVLNEAGGVNVATVPINQEKHDHFAYLRLGLGLEKQLSPCFSTRFDYVYTHYGRHSFHANAAVTDVTVVDSVKIKPRDHAFTFGLSYYLCQSKCFIDEPCLECPDFYGFYAGAAIGGSFIDAKIRETLLFSGAAAGTGTFQQPIDLKNRVQNTKFMGTLYAGFGYQRCRFFAGLEPFLKFADFSRKRVQTAAISTPILSVVNPIILETRIDTRARISPCQFGVDLRPGFLLSPTTLFYAKIGTSYARLHVRSQVTAESLNFPGPGNDLIAITSQSKKRSVATLRAGCGIETVFCPCLHIRADYVYTLYPSTLHLSGVASAAITGTTTTITNDARFDFRSHDVTIGISRYF